VRLVVLPPPATAALVAGDLVAASAHAGVELTDYFTGPDCTWLWRLRLDQVTADPESRRWVARVGVDARTGAVVGHAARAAAPGARGARRPDGARDDRSGQRRVARDDRWAGLHARGRAAGRGERR
jgi:hypothetical protein